VLIEQTNEGELLEAVTKIVKKDLNGNWCMQMSYCLTKNQFASLELRESLEARRPTYFGVYRKSQFRDNGRNVTYEESSANFGDAMNLQTGVFTAPADGAYYFAFNAFAFQGSGSPHCRLHLLCNDKIEAHSYSDNKNVMMSMSKLLNLTAGDKVSVRLDQGVLWDCGNELFIQFSGFSVCA
jgi:C1q domain